MKKFATLASSVVLSIAASSSHAALYDVALDLNATVSGGGGGSQTGSAVGTYDDITKIMTLDFSATVVANGFFGIGKGTMNHTGQSIFNFSGTPSGTNEVLTCVDVSGSNCGSVPAGPQALQSVSALSAEAVGGTFQSVSVYLIATTTQNWTITAFDAQPVPVPAAAWMFGSALLGLTGVARRKAKAA